MKRLWIGVVLLAVMLVAGVAMLVVSRNFYGAFSAALEQAGECALAENWEEAGDKLRESRRLWEQYRRFWSASADHEPVEDVQSLFSQLEVYEKCRLGVDFAAVCRSIVHRAEAIDEAQGLKWWSIL